MSSSSKKKLRKEQVAEQLTEKQLHEQKEAKKLKIYSTVAVAVLVFLVVVALTVGTVRTINNVGFMDKLFPAVTVGETKITSSELNYYFIDGIDKFFDENGSYVSLMGLDANKPLDEQYISEGVTWADDFLNAAVEEVRKTYALVEAANAAGFELPQEEIDRIDASFSQMGMNAFMGGIDVNTFLKTNYGLSASTDTYRNYLINMALANAYYAEYMNNIEYTDADIAAEEEKNGFMYNDYSYNYYYLSASKYATGGTEDENGNITYSVAERQAAAEKAEKDALALTSGKVTAESLDNAIAALAVNAESTTAKSTALTSQPYTSVNTNIREWIAAPERKVGDVGCIPSTSTATDEDGNEVELIVGYYIVLFNGVESNEINMVNVRHLLVNFEGGSVDENGYTVYSDEEKAAAYDKAKELYNTWKNGEATEDTFGALANMNSDDGNGTTGGLVENIYPGKTVTNFNDWCFDPDREAGDVEIIETEYGYHIMYFVSTSDQTYREFLIDSTLRTEDAQTWFAERLAATVASEVNTKRIDTSISLNISAPSTSEAEATEAAE